VLCDRRQIECERVRHGVAAERLERYVHIASIDPCDPLCHIAAAIIGSVRDVRAPDGKQPVWLRRIGHARARIDLDVTRVRDRLELKAIRKQGLFQLVGDPDLEAAVLCAQLIAAMRTYSTGSGVFR